MRDWRRLLTVFVYALSNDGRLRLARRQEYLSFCQQPLGSGWIDLLFLISRIAWPLARCNPALRLGAYPVRVGVFHSIQ
jgi:hypothetical protein